MTDKGFIATLQYNAFQEGPRNFTTRILQRSRKTEATA